MSRKFTSVKSLQILHRGAIYPFSVWWIYYCYSSESSGEKTDKAHLCVLPCSPDPVQTTPKLEILKFRILFHKIFKLTPDYKKKRRSEILLFKIGLSTTSIMDCQLLRQKFRQIISVTKTSTALVLLLSPRQNMN